MKTLELADFKSAAFALGVDSATIRAVAEVESRGAGFMPDGKPVVLFEPHIFFKELKKRNIDPKKHLVGNGDILYPVWGSRPYGKVSQQHGRMERAAKINRNAALSSASWGRFQIMGFNWKACGCDSLQDFVNDMYESEAKQLACFCAYIINTGLQDELQAHDWRGFGRGFNGPLFERNRYHIKLAQAYARFT